MKYSGRMSLPVRGGTLPIRGGTLPIRDDVKRRMSKISLPDNITETRPVSRITRESEGTMFNQ